MNLPFSNAGAARPHRPSGHAVVRVGAGAVEALLPPERLGNAGAGPACRYLRFEHDLELGHELATAIVRHFGEAGVRTKRLVLAISPEWVHSKVEEVPALGARDLELVIARKSGHAAELDPDLVSFSALALDAPDAPSRRWLLHVVERQPLADLQESLRRSGYKVLSIVPARTAAFLADRSISPSDPVGDTGTGTETGATADDAAPAKGARLCLLFEESCCSVGLLSSGRLVQLSTLPGNAESFWTDVQAGRSLVQELRGIDAFWRRTSRGEQIVRVTIGGVAPEDVTRLEPAVRSSLGQVPIDALAGVHLTATAGEPSGHVEAALLAAIDSPRVRALDLSVPLRPRARVLVGTALVSLAVFGTLASTYRMELSLQAASIAVQAQVMHAAAADLEELRGLKARVTTAEGRILQTCAELEAASKIGLVADHLMGQIIDCFGADEVLLSVNAMGSTLAGGRGGGGGAVNGGVVRVRGAVIDRPGRTAVSLSRLEQRFLAMDGVSKVEIELPSLSDRGGDLLGRGLSSLRFTAMIELAAPMPTLAMDVPATSSLDDVPLPGAPGAGPGGHHGGTTR